MRKYAIISHYDENSTGVIQEIKIELRLTKWYRNSTTRTIKRKWNQCIESHRILGSNVRGEWEEKKDRKG